jgi:hypothetical protein
VKETTTMKRITSTGLAAFTLVLGAAACGDDESAGDDTPDIDASEDIDADGGDPPPPALGPQMDRMGRPAVNTALNHTFDSDAVATQAAKDAWNQNDDRSTWVATFGEEIEANLAILDSLDTNCGNQLLAGATVDDERYDTLASVLADDQLYVNSASGTCTVYLAVEGNAIGIPNNDCGGRTPGYDVIATTYSVLAVGALSGVDDGVAADDATTSTSEFPFLADPS